MNVVPVYTNEIRRLKTSIKSLEDRMTKLPLMSKFIILEINNLQAKILDIEVELKKENDIVDAYIGNILKQHNSVGRKLKFLGV